MGDFGFYTGVTGQLDNASVSIAQPPDHRRHLVEVVDLVPLLVVDEHLVAAMGDDQVVDPRRWHSCSKPGVLRFAHDTLSP